MKFTEREMTVAVDAVGKQLYAAARPPWKRKTVDADWAELTAGQKYQRRAAAGEMVLPALLALPERPTVGTTPEFSDEEYAEAAKAGARQLVDQREPGAWDRLGARKQGSMVEATAALTRLAVVAMPIRQDPDAIIVPDHL
jgi:hypothetical protein